MRMAPNRTVFSLLSRMSSSSSYSKLWL